MSFFQNLKGYPELPLIQIASLQRGYDLPVQNRKNGNVPIYAANGKNGTHNEAKAIGPGVITGRSGTIGKVHYVDGDYWPLNTSLYVTDFHGNHPRWVYYMLQAFKLERFVEGAGVPTLNRNLVHGEKIPLPPLHEQRRIAAILDQADALRAKRREALAQLDSLTQSIFVEMFGDPSKGLNDIGFEPLGEQLLFITSGGRGWAGYYANTGNRFIRSLDVQMNNIGSDDIVFVNAPDNAEARRTEVKVGDVLLTITGSLIGRVAAVPDNLAGAYISQHVAILRVNQNRIIPKFLSHFLSFDLGGQRQIVKAQYGQTKPGLNFDQIRSFNVPLPPLELQNEFLNRVACVDNLKVLHQHGLSESNSLFASLQHRAFRGEL